MRLRIAQLADNLRTAILDGKLAVYPLDALPEDEAVKLHAYGYDGIAVTSGDKVIGGATLQWNPDDWYEIETLWADSPVAAVTLLYSCLEYYKKILPSKNISPAALGVVERFYKKYKGTEVVQEEVHNPGTANDALRAGYVWSPKLRKVPAEVKKPENEQELKTLWSSVLSGFNVAYSDPKKTKAEHPDGYYNRYDFEGLIEHLQKLFHEGEAAENRALQWISKHHDELLQMDNYWSRIILKMYEDRMEY